MGNIMNTNFRNATQVTDELKSALMKYNDYQISIKGGNEKKAITFLKEAGQLAYSAMEHAYKHYLYHYYYKLHEEKRIDNETFREKEAFLTEVFWDKETGIYKHANHKDLMDEFCTIVKEPCANVQLILKESQSGNNDIKHEGEVPDPKKLLPALIEMKKFFVSYISKAVEYPDLTIVSYEKNSAFLKIRTECNNFSDLFSYVFVSGVSEDFTDDVTQNLFSINWDLYIDFDPYTQDHGLYEKYIRIKKQGVASVKSLDVYENTGFTRSLEEPHWIIANGIEGKEDSISTTKRDWRRKHGRHLGKMLQNYKSSYIKPIKMFISESVPDELLEEFVEICGDSFFSEADGVHKGIQAFVLNGKERLPYYDESFVERVDLSDLEFLDCVRTGVTNMHYDEEELSLPGITGENLLEKDLRQRIMNFGELLFDGIEKNDPIGTQYEFYRGERAIYWNELNNGVDVKRTEYEQHTKGQILDILGKQPYSYYEIYYKPGFGGTTLMRRIAWDFHAFYPTIVLFRYEKEDKDVLKQLTLKLTKPLLVLMDSNFVKKETAEAVVGDLKAWNESHLVIYINRIRSNSLPKSSATLFSIPELDEHTGEIKRIVDALGPYVTKEICKGRLSSLERNPETIEERSPFFFALTAYDEDFVGIKPYIKNFMKALTDEYRKFLVYLAIADYINKPIDIEYFGNVLHTDMPEEIMRDNTAFSTLVTYVHTYDRQTFCKLKFPAVGNEILRQATNGFSADTGEKIKFINLTDYIIDFITTSNITEEIPNKNIVDFLVELLIIRHEDLDFIRPQFSDMITQIGLGSNTITGVKWSQEGQAAVERIFQALVRTYKNDSHFKAHLARFKSYIQEDYGGALKIIDEALENERENGKIDSLLLHMKAMVYATRITSQFIPEIKKANIDDNTAIIDDILQEIRFNLHEAEILFEEVRKNQRGVAGHISDISLCINIIDMGRVLEGKDTALFLSDHHDDWYMDMADRANILYDECLEYREELDPALDKIEIEKINEIGKGISTIRNGIDKTIELYQSYLSSVSDRTKPKIRRHLARAYEERNGKMDWAAVSELMMENIQEDPNNESNIRIWFRAILHLKDDDPDETLRKAVMLLNIWLSNDDKNLEAHYYRFILTFIEAVEGISGAESRLKDYQLRMKDLAKDRPNRTSIRYWLGKNGRGIDRLIHKSSFPLSDSLRANQALLKLKGRVSTKYANEKHAYIDAYKTEIFFNPSQTEGRISEANKNQQIVFGVGFSFDGPRAYNSSVELYTGTQVLPQSEREPLRRGTRVTCQVLSTRIDQFINVKIIGYNEIGSIHISQLSDPYNQNNRPKVNGPLIDAWAIRKKSINCAGGGNKTIWELSMNPPHTERLGYGIGELIGKMNITVPAVSTNGDGIGEKGNFQKEKDKRNTDYAKNDENANLKELATIVNRDHEVSEVGASGEGFSANKEKVPVIGENYIVKSLTYDVNKRQLKGLVTIGNISYNVVVPGCTKKMFDGIKKRGTVSAKIVQKSGDKLIAKL